MASRFRDIKDFLNLLQDVKGPTAKGNYTARCPAHDDRQASLTVCEKESDKDGKRRIYVCCQKKTCTVDMIVSALGCTTRDLVLDTDDSLPSGKKVINVGKSKPPAEYANYEAAYGYLGKFERVYTYRDATGKPLFEVARIDTSTPEKRDKTFRQHILIGEGWTFPLVKGAPDELKANIYRLPEVTVAIKEGKPVFVVEGEKDCENMAALGYVATTCPMGAGKWHEAHSEQLRGADAYIIPDNDDTGRNHARQVAEGLHGIAHSVRVLDIAAACEGLPIKGDITDFFKILGRAKGEETLCKLMKSTPEGTPAPDDPCEAAAELYGRVGGYCVKDCCICQQTDDGARKLGTFVALPSRIVTRDDGVNLDKIFVIDGWARGGRALPQVQVAAAKFASMAWVLENWDFAANIMPGNVVKDKLRYAITEVGEMAASRQIVYTHTGWRRIDGKWAYLYQGGAIGAVGVSVDLDNALGSYTLQSDDDMPLMDAARKSLTTRFCMAEHIAVPLLGAMFLAPLREFLKQAGCAPGFALFLLGRSGGHKSTAIALMLSYFGDFHSKNLPASFNDTANSIRKKAFLLKDFPISVDDYHPETSMQERRKMESTAQLLSRAFGDGADRGRMKADLSLQESMPPRGIAVMSGEDMPNIGESGTARYYVVSVDKDDIPITDALTEAQAMAKRGILRKVMRGYIEYLLPHTDMLAAQLETKFIKLRAYATKEIQGAHGRAPEAVAHIMLGYSMMQDYLVSIGALSNEEANADFTDAWRVLIKNSAEQSKEMQDEKPCKMFLSAIGEMLVSKAADVKDLTIADSPNPIKGMIGYMDADYLYLLPETTYTMVAKLYGDQGMTFPLSKRLLFKQMRDDGLAIAGADGKTTRSKSVAGKMMRLLWVPRRCMDGSVPPPAEEQISIESLSNGHTVVDGEDIPF